jgi:hypothetical protein
MIKKETEMLNDSGQEKPSQKTLIHYAILEGLDQINTFSHFLMATQASKYEVEKNIIAGLAVVICEKTQDLKNVMEEMSKENRPIGLK